MVHSQSTKSSKLWLFFFFSGSSFLAGCIFVILSQRSCLETWNISTEIRRKQLTQLKITRLTPSTSTPAVSTTVEGVAVNVVTDGPLIPDNFAALIHNYNSNLPLNWTIQLFTTSQTHPRLLQIPGLMRLVDNGRVNLQQLPQALDKLQKQQLMRAPWVWQSCRADKVLVFDLSSALCSNSPWTVRDFMGYDWVGAAWKWAKPGLAYVWGGNGAFSLRNRTLVLRVIEEQISEQLRLHKVRNQSSIDTSNPVEIRFAQVKKNDDMWFVQKLFDMRQREEAAGHMGVIRLAPREVSMRWAVEELFEESEPTPLGVYHTMRSMPDELRDKFIKRCPEAKRLFDAKHEKNVPPSPAPVESLKFKKKKKKKMKQH